MAKRITPRQKAARRRNIAVARAAKKKASPKSFKSIKDAAKHVKKYGGQAQTKNAYVMHSKKIGKMVTVPKNERGGIKEAMKKVAKRNSASARKVIAIKYRMERNRGATKSAALFTALTVGAKRNKKYAGRKAVKFGMVEAKKMGLNRRDQLRVGRNYSRNILADVRRISK